MTILISPALSKTLLQILLDILELPYLQPVLSDIRFSLVWMMVQDYCQQKFWSPFFYAVLMYRGL